MVRDIAVVDDEALIRGTISCLLEHSNFNAHSFASPTTFLESLDTVPAYHCVLLDERMKPMNGVETFQKMREMGCQAPGLMVTGVATANLTMKAIDRGFFYVLQKPIKEEELVQRVNQACEKHEQYLAQAAHKALQLKLLNSLSDRERQVLKHVANGHLNKQIASILGVGLRTVETYRNRVMQKIGAKSAADAIAFAISVGMRERGFPYL